ncbi:hypothetical protein Q7C36_010255 [Tachysurus vachellii]|uniref:Uncharacterized protein n=1 Tax=Tachysurus vachellii TaxID=175792 RepID=A0AA88SNH8_TACVA|nr:hypothetical protein Q7C36_010255 [Tachysurus vachellii]
MSSSAGFLTLCCVLSVNLCTLVAFPAHPCKLKEMLKRLEHEIKGLNSTLLVNHVHYHAEVIPALVIDKSLPIHKQNETAACGLVYVTKALEQIQDHYSKLIHDDQIQRQFNVIMTRLNEYISPCARLVLAKCNNVPHPTFPDSHFHAKNWTRNFLESSVKFIHRLIHFLEKAQTV